ncbi:MAG: RNA polymerase sigma factor [Candidatus Dormibacteria bacterium]
MTSLAREGEQDSFDRLAAPHVAGAVRLAYGLLLSRAEAEDVVQDSLARAWRKMHTFRADQPFGPWLLAIVANECRRHRRSHWWWRVERTDRVPERPVEAGSETERLMDIRTAVRTLPHDQRVVVALRFSLDLSVDEIARTLGLPPGTVKSRLSRALDQLRRHPQLKEVDHE